MPRQIPRPIDLKIAKFLSDCRVSPGECGFTSGDGDPGTNGVITKLAAERGIKTIPAVLQGATFSDEEYALHKGERHDLVIPLRL